MITSAPSPARKMNTPRPRPAACPSPDRPDAVAAAAAADHISVLSAAEDIGAFAA